MQQSNTNSKRGPNIFSTALYIKSKADRPEIRGFKSFSFSQKIATNTTIKMKACVSLSNVFLGTFLEFTHGGPHICSLFLCLCSQQTFCFPRRDCSICIGKRALDAFSVCHVFIQFEMKHVAAKLMLVLQEKPQMS